APAKTQAALLEAMQERTVTADGVSHQLSDTFTVFATQNPIEFEGTYPLPEAELDRFMIKAQFGYPEAQVEQGILTRYVEGFEADRTDTYGVTAVTDGPGLEALGGAGFITAGTLDAMLLGDAVLLALIWIDATLTPLPTAPQATAPHMTWAWWREQLIAAWFVLSVVGIVARAVQGFSLGEYFAVVIIIN